MMRSLMMAFGLLLLVASPSRAYIAVSANRLTLCEVMLEFPTVVALKLDKYKPDTGAAVFTLETLYQGPKPEGVVRIIFRDGGQIPERLRELKTGDIVVAFIGSPDRRTLIHTPGGWVLAVPDQGWERFTQFRDDFQALFAGQPSELGTAIAQLRRGGAVTVPVHPKGLIKGEFLYVRYDAEYPHRRWPTLPPNQPPMKPDAIARAATSKSVVDRQQAMLAMQSLADAEKDLRQGLTDTHPDVRLAATVSLGQQAKRSEETLQALAKNLNDDDRFVCAFAAWGLGRSGKSAEFAVPALIKALESRNFDHDYRPLRGAEAAEAILRITPESKAAQTAIRFFLSDRMLKFHGVDSEGTRTAAARALGRIGSTTRSALPDLVKSLSDPVAETRVAVAEAILLISADAKERTAAVKVLQTEITQGQGWARIHAIRASSSTKAVDLAPTLKKLLNETDRTIQAEATKALASIEPPK